MNWLIALQLIPLVTNLVKIAEQLLGAGTGVRKKLFVIDGVEQVVKTMTNTSTGGQKETWEVINATMEPIKILIDIVANLFFPHERRKGAGE